MFFQSVIKTFFYSKHFQLYNKFVKLTKLAWELTGRIYICPQSFLYGPFCTWSILSRRWAKVLQMWFSCLVNTYIYRLTHSGSALSGFTCMSSVTMNEKFQYRTRLCKCSIENFEFIVSERVQVNPGNSRAASVLTFLLIKLNTLHKTIVKF